MAKKQDAYYFNNFIECAEHSTKAAELLYKIATGFDASKAQNYMSEMHTIEHSADMKKHELMEELVKAFITPIDREDIVEVCQNLDNLTDKIEDVVIRIYCNNVTSIRPDAVALIEVVKKCSEEVLEMMREFPDFKHSKKLKEHVIRINSYEEEADRLYINAMKGLHTDNDNIMEVIAWRDIYAYLEKCSDAAEDIADIVESVVLKNG
ncbi:MAG: DUF47 family protein [Clostridia bacterium]|nr:DUF47 family protein [Clostridia bacterium]